MGLGDGAFFFVHKKVNYTFFNIENKCRFVS